MVRPIHAVMTALLTVGCTPADRIADDQRLPLAVASDSRFAYWTNSGDATLRRVALGGGDDEIIAKGGEPFAVAVDEGAVYWTDRGAGTVFRQDKLTGERTEIATQQPQPTWLVVSGAWVCWIAYGIETPESYVASSGRVVCSISGEAPVRVASEVNRPWGIAVDDTHIYWTELHTPSDPNAGSVWRVLRSGGAAELVSDQQAAPRGIAVENGRVCWANWGLTDPATQRHDGSIVCWTEASGSGAIASQQPEPFDVRLANGIVYWTGGNVVGQKGTVRRFTTAVDTLIDTASYVRGLAVATESIYFAEIGTGTNGAVRRVNR